MWGYQRFCYIYLVLKMFNKQRGEYPSRRNQNVNLSQFLSRQDTAYFTVITDNILQF